jgi:hypothetical protein
MGLEHAGEDVLEIDLRLDGHAFFPCAILAEVPLSLLVLEDLREVYGGRLFLAALAEHAVPLSVRPGFNIMILRGRGEVK